MEFSKIIISLIAGAILGISGTFYLFNERLTVIETKFEFFNDIKQNTKVISQNVNKNSNHSVHSRILFHDSFDYNVLNWELSDKNLQKNYFSNGRFIFSQNNSKNKYFLSFIKLPSLTENYNIVLSSYWKEGDQGKEYGVLLLHSDNCYLFNISKSGYAGVGSTINDKFVALINKKGGYINKTNTKLVQKIKIRGKKFLYYINDSFVGEGLADKFKWNKIGVYIVGNQTVEFDELVITEK